MPICLEFAQRNMTMEMRGAQPERRGDAPPTNRQIFFTSIRFSLSISIYLSFSSAFFSNIIVRNIKMLFKCIFPYKWFFNKIFVIFILRFGRCFVVDIVVVVVTAAVDAVVVVCYWWMGHRHCDCHWFEARWMKNRNICIFSHNITHSMQAF